MNGLDLNPHPLSLSRGRSITGTRVCTVFGLFFFLLWPGASPALGRTGLEGVGGVYFSTVLNEVICQVHFCLNA